VAAGALAASGCSRTTRFECTTSDGDRRLWETAIARGLVYGSSGATWQLADPAYRRLFAREAAILLTEDDLLWWKIRPTPESDLQLESGDEIVALAERHEQLVLGAHLVWDQGFGGGWTQADLEGMSESRARAVLSDSVEQVVARYRGRVAAWIVANEVLDRYGLRPDVPWWGTIGPAYVAEAFHVAHDADGDALLVLNDYGYETDDDSSYAEEKRVATLDFLDELLAGDVPVHALGIQAHLHAQRIASGFDARAYRRFLGEVADRGLRILITELDVLDDGLPAGVRARDRGVAAALERYLEVALDEPAVAAVLTFGLSDRYTWLQEERPRDDNTPRRPLPFDAELRPKAAYGALQRSLAGAPRREPLWRPPRC
jgi:endo-1,4-beta-xylanase